jgi:hypothetical protein
MSDVIPMLPRADVPRFAAPIDLVAEARLAPLFVDGDITLGQLLRALHPEGLTLAPGRDNRSFAIVRVAREGGP